MHNAIGKLKSVHHVFSKSLQAYMHDSFKLRKTHVATRSWLNVLGLHGCDSGAEPGAGRL